MYETLLVVYLLTALGLIGLVLVQQGKGADMGASFGAGASNTVFGSSGSGNFMTRTTAILATIFFIISLVLGNITHTQNNVGSEWEDLSQPAAAQQKAAETPVKAADTNSDIPTK